MKEPWLAAVLNAIPFGWGYLYLGRRGRFVLTFFVGAPGAFVAGFIMAFWSTYALFSCQYGDPCTTGQQSFALLLWSSPMVLLAAFTARDAYRLADEM